MAATAPAPETTAAAFFSTLQKGLEATHDSVFASEDLKAKAKQQLPIMAELFKTMQFLVNFNREAAVEEEKCKAAAAATTATVQDTSGSVQDTAAAPPVAAAAVPKAKPPPPLAPSKPLVFGPASSSDRAGANRTQPYENRTLDELQAIVQSLAVAKEAPAVVVVA